MIAQHLLIAALILVASGAAAASLTFLVLKELRRREILDHPNQRSSHNIPTPRGGGLAVTPIVIGGFIIITLFGPAPAGTGMVLAMAALLAVTSWFDDVGGLRPQVRLAIQTMAVGVAVAAFPPDHLTFQGHLPLVPDRILTAIGWLWFVNLFNFMDGIDGIAGTELAAIGIGLALVAAITAASPYLIPYSLVLAGGGLGFLFWNWHPARIFLGDIGSIPLGFVTGWLLLDAAASGLWLAALILPLYYLADATLTLLRRAVRRQRLWEAHREHSYQKAVRSGLRHDQAVWRIILANLMLIAAAVSTPVTGLWALVPAGVSVGILLWQFEAGAKRDARRRTSGYPDGGLT